MSMLIEPTVEKFFKEHPLPPLKETYFSEDVIFFLRSNERAVYNFFEELKKRYCFNGYIYGCGSSTIWTLVEAFPKGVIPKGLILADIEPRIICYTKLFIRLLKRHQEFESLVDELAAINQNSWKEALTSIVEEETDSVLQKALMEWLESNEEGLAPGSKWGWQKSVLLSKANREQWFHAKSSRISVLTLISRNYPVLHSLAKSGNLIIVYRDVFDSMLLKLISSLPGFMHSTSLIYLSNALDHVLIRSDFRKDYSSFCRFTNYVNDTLFSGFHRLTPELPHKIITIDTFRSHKYFLRSHEGIPHFAFHQFYLDS